ncbi:MAG TPA: helix-turn-helix transcriptional regulator, partial [Acholeplasmataceae bacterium]|nr:helix-turn-helix transcriptional regulator [Acholeplasmataceae bacterium]
MKIKDVIFDNRKKIRLTQEQLADQLNVSSKTVSNWERGVSYPDILLIAKICNVLNISINEFFQVEDVNEIEGKIEYDYKAIDKFKTSMII